MQHAVTTYFTGEKNAGLVLAALGVIGLAAAFLFWPSRVGLRAFAVTLGVLGLIEIAIGAGLYVRTGPQVSGLLATLGSDATRFFADEAVRMARVQRNFVVVQYVELAVIVVAAVAALVMKNRSSIAGIALGLVVNAAILLAFDIVAERRGAVYLRRIEERRGY